MGSLADGSIEFVLNDNELEEGEIRDAEESSIINFENAPSYFYDLEEGEIRDKLEEIMVCVQDAPTYFDELEEGEIREERDPLYVAVPLNQGRELSEAEHIKDQAKDPNENSLIRQVKEVCDKRSRELLFLQDLERKQFNLLKHELEKELKINYSGKLSTHFFEILDGKFKKHMKNQDLKLIVMLINARNREDKLKKQWLAKASEGTLEESFCEIPLPNSGFTMDIFNYGAEMEHLLEKTGYAPSDEMHLDAVQDEGCSGFEALLEAQAESDDMIAEVSQCNDESHATCVDPKVILKSPSISTQRSHFESEKMPEERNEIGGHETEPGGPETLEENLNCNTNSPQVIMSNSILLCDGDSLEEIVPLEEHELASVNKILVGSEEMNLQNSISTSNCPSRTVHCDQTVATSSSTYASTRSQEPQVNPAINLPYTSNSTTAAALRCSAEGNVIANQNEASAEQPATQMPVPDVDIGTELLQMVRSNISIDPLQNELSSLRNLQNALNERHKEKIAGLRAEYKRELDNIRKKYEKMKVEADAQWSNYKAHLNVSYQKVCMHQRLAEEFQQMVYRPSVIGQLPFHGIVGQEQFPQSSHPQFTPNSILRPAALLGTQLPSTSSYGLLPNPYTIPQIIQPQATMAVAPSAMQRPVLPRQIPQYFLNQPTHMHSSLAHAPIGGPGLMGFCPGVSPSNYVRPPSQLGPRVPMSMTNFGNI